ncbi:ABC transporter permease [Rhodococcus rhodochrous]|uniref:ABC transporter permease n=1 Tax=Rhodococcus rhodochrous TaxID=1829 RepID=UPI0026D505CF
MRISEEIDALEVMAVPSLPSCDLPDDRRFVAVIPLYIIGLLAAYLATRTISTLFNGQSSGSYDHYFYLFLPPEDCCIRSRKCWSRVRVILIHCYYGFHASGGPAGVGVAVGRAVRTAIVTIAILDFFLSLAIWGTTTTVRVAG